MFEPGLALIDPSIPLVVDQWTRSRLVGDRGAAMEATLHRILLGICAAIISITSPAEAASVMDWRATVDAVVRDVQVNHPHPFSRIGETAFLRAADALKQDLPNLSEEQRMVRAMRLIASIGDGHTQLSPSDPAFARWYGVRFYQFSDGYFITSAHESLSELVGAQVLQIAGQPVHEVAEQARDLRGADNYFDRMQRLEVLNNAPLMQGLGFADREQTLRLRMRLITGRVVERTLTPMATDNPQFEANGPAFSWSGMSEIYTPPVSSYEAMISAFHNLRASAFREVDVGRPLHLMYRRLEVARAVPEQDAYYIQLNAISPEEALPFLREHLAAVDVQRPRRLIIDLRYNAGGDGSRTLELVSQFVERLPSPPWRELYLILGRRTFSAGIILADALIDHLPLTVVGEPAGAGLNHFGDAELHEYAQPRLALSVSTLSHQLSDSNDLRPFIPVDTPAQMSFADYASGRDPATDGILNGAEMRSIPQIALANGGSAARAAWDDARVRFARLPWWRPPSELSMRAACDALREQGRLEDSLQTCTLTTEMWPFVWNSWYNLSMTQHALGRERERAASLYCVLALDPNNFNLEEIREVQREVGAAPLPQGCRVT